MSFSAFRCVWASDPAPRMIKDERTNIDPSRSVYNRDTSDTLG
jgi:hypothetical protein